MKSNTLFALLLAIGVSVVLSQSLRADFYSAATNNAPQEGQGDLASDVTTLFAVDSEGARNSADVYGFCTESPQEGSWQDDPRRDPVQYEEDDSDNPETLVNQRSDSSLSASDYDSDSDYDRDPDDDPGPDDDPKRNITPEPVTLVLFGLGMAGLLPLSFRKRQ